MKLPLVYCPACDCDVTAYIKDAIRGAIKRLSSAGGKARRDKLSPARRSEIARQAANARWANARG